MIQELVLDVPNKIHQYLLMNFVYWYMILRLFKGF